jgi:hypothetical protein
MTAAAAGIVGLLLSAGCAAEPRMARSAPALGTARYVDAAAEKPRIRWGDAPESLNDRCIVRKSKLNLRMPPIFVNGQAIGFC